MYSEIREEHHKGGRASSTTRCGKASPTWRSRSRIRWSCRYTTPRRQAHRRAVLVAVQRSAVLRTPLAHGGRRQSPLCGSPDAPADAPGLSRAYLSIHILTFTLHLVVVGQKCTGEAVLHPILYRPMPCCPRDCGVAEDPIRRTRSGRRKAIAAIGHQFGSRRTLPFSFPLFV